MFEWGKIQRELSYIFFKKKEMIKHQGMEHRIMKNTLKCEIV